MFLELNEISLRFYLEADLRAVSERWMRETFSSYQPPCKPPTNDDLLRLNTLPNAFHFLREETRPVLRKLISCQALTPSHPHIQLLTVQLGNHRLYQLNNYKSHFRAQCFLQRPQIHREGFDKIEYIGHIEILFCIGEVIYRLAFLVFSPIKVTRF